MFEKLRPYAHLFGKTPDEKLAELAGLSMDEFRQAKAALVAESKAAEPPQKPRSEPKTESDSAPESGGRATLKSLEVEISTLRVALLEQRAEATMLKGDLRELQDSHRSLAAAHYALDAEVRGLRASPAPAARTGAPVRAELTEAQLNSPVKVTRNAKVTGPNGRPMVISFGDIHPAGEMSAFLLKNYPDHVKIYEVKG